MSKLHYAVVTSLLFPNVALAQQIMKGPELIGGTIFDEDYPREAQRLGQEGPVSFKLYIDLSGRVEKCQVVRSSGSELLDRETCDMTKTRFKYKSAIDEKGEPIVSVHWMTIIWRLSRNFPERLGDFVFEVKKLPNKKPTAQVEISVLTNDTGAIIGCGPVPGYAVSNADVYVAAACPALKALGAIDPTIWLDGNPKRAVQRIKVGFAVQPKPKV